MSGTEMVWALPDSFVYHRHLDHLQAAQQPKAEAIEVWTAATRGMRACVPCERRRVNSLPLKLTMHALRRWRMRVNRDAGPATAEREILTFLAGSHRSSRAPRWFDASKRTEGRKAAYATNPDWPGVVAVISERRVVTVVTRDLSKRTAQWGRESTQVQRRRAVAS